MLLFIIGYHACLIRKSKRLRIALATLNARYAHSSLALRYLKANLGDLEAHARIYEFVSGARVETIAEDLLADSPSIIALSVYIWNVEELTRLSNLLKALVPEIILIIGGPEVSHETEQQPIFALCDYVITGAARTCICPTVSPTAQWQAALVEEDCR